MDPRQQTQAYSGANTQRPGGSYGFNGLLNDQFSSFNEDHDSAFESSWNNQAIPQQQQHVNSFEQGSHAWQPAAYQSTNYPSTQSFGVQSREFEQPYSRSPSNFHYPSIDPNQSQTYPPSTSYDSANPYEDPLYGHGPLTNGAQFEYPAPAGLHQQPHNTISPQALQAYPTFLPQSAPDLNQKVSSSNLPRSCS